MGQLEAGTATNVASESAIEETLKMLVDGAEKLRNRLHPVLRPRPTLQERPAKAVPPPNEVRCPLRERLSSEILEVLSDIHNRLEL